VYASMIAGVSGAAVVVVFCGEYVWRGAERRT